MNLHTYTVKFLTTPPLFLLYNTKTGHDNHCATGLGYFFLADFIYMVEKSRGDGDYQKVCYLWI